MFFRDILDEVLDDQAAADLLNIKRHAFSVGSTARPAGDMCDGALLIFFITQTE
jgi:hypothetical protein